MRMFALPDWVYPRPRGGTFASPWLAFHSLGLSPPTRGNPRTLTSRIIRVRSIPAHAGEPLARSVVRFGRRVYPRPRGGTPPAKPKGGAGCGLSPPTRGNPPPAGQRHAGHGSIPAHAGEPVPRTRIRIRGTVYPRPRGGTCCGLSAISSDRGLSPPTRGNRAGWTGSRENRRSIPAHAGEPQTARSPSPSAWVYPRPRGGTAI